LIHKIINRILYLEYSVANYIDRVKLKTLIGVKRSTKLDQNNIFNYLAFFVIAICLL